MPVSRVRIRIFRIRMFLGLLDPHLDCNLFVRLRIQLRIPYSSINKQKYKEKPFLLFISFVTSLCLFSLKNDVNVLSKRMSIKTYKKTIICCCRLDGHGLEEQDPHPDPLVTKRMRTKMSLINGL
jgi:hypothetical protein